MSTCPPYYQAKNAFGHVQEGAEVIEMLVALFGVEAARHYMACELVVKALRLSTRPETAESDLAKIRAACDVLERLL